MRQAKPIPEDISEYFQYDPLSYSGLVRIKSDSPRGKCGPTGYLSAKGYYYITHHNKTYMAHRVIYTLLKSPISTKTIVDHKDNNKKNNLIDNLRLVTNSENQFNSITNKNPFRIKGLSKHPLSKKWTGKISAYGQRYVFHHEDRNEVELWLINKRKELHGDYCRH